MTAISLPPGFSSVLSTSPKTVRSTAKWLQSDRSIHHSIVADSNMQRSERPAPRRQSARSTAPTAPRRAKGNAMRFAAAPTAEGRPCTRTHIGTMQHSAARRRGAHALPCGWGQVGFGYLPVEGLLDVAVEGEELLETACGGGVRVIQVGKPDLPTNNHNDQQNPVCE